MKKVVRTDFNSTTLRRGVRDLNIQLYSHDKNNAGFEFVIKNEVDLSQYKARALFDFRETDITWETTGTIETNVVKIKFDTDLISKCEEVIGYLFLDSETDSLDIFKFKFTVILSEIDKQEVGKRGFRYIKDEKVVDVITRSELEEELKKLQVNSGIDLSNYLTTRVATETYATKQELGDYALKTELPSVRGLVTTEQLTEAKNNVVEEIKKLGYAKTTEIPAPYNDSALAGRVTNLENKPTVDLSNYALKTEIPTPYNDSALSERVTNLENKVDKDTIYDDSDLKSRVQALENRPTTTITPYDDSEVNRRLTVLEARPTVTAYNDKPLSDRVTALEDKQDKDTVYDDSALSKRVEALENKPEGATKEAVNGLTDRVVVLESKTDKDTVYNDTEVKERLTVLESKPTVDTSKFITDEKLTAKNFVTKDELNVLKPNQTLTLNNGTLSISGGNSVVLPVSKYEIHGTGMPNGVVEAEIGTTYIDKNKTNGAFKWIKTTNGGNQGWEVLTGDTGWRTLNSISKLTVDGRTSTIKIRRVNNLVTYQFGGLQWGWFGIVRRDGAGHVGHGSSGDRGAKVLGVGGIPYGFRSEASLVGGTYDDRGRPYGVWYLGGLDDSNYMQFTFNDPIPTDRDIGDIRVSAVSYLTAEPWPQQLP